MKIEKLSENQIKLTLTHADLKEHNINLEELMKPTEQTKELFKDIMEQAFDSCGFSFENAPLMIEATPVSVDGLMLIVTRLPDQESTKDKISLLSQNKELRRYRKKPIVRRKAQQLNDDGILIYSFETMEDAGHAAGQIASFFQGFSQLYRYQNRYFYLLQTSLPEENAAVLLEQRLHEYGQKHTSSVLAKYHLMEQGELLLDDPCVSRLADFYD